MNAMMWLWGLSLAAAQEAPSWVTRFEERGIDPAMVADCQPLGEALQRLPGWIAAMPTDREGPPIAPDFADRLATPEGRAALGFAEDGHFRVALSMPDEGGQGGQLSLQVGFAGSTDDVGKLLQAMMGRPFPQAVWQDGVLRSVGGEPAPPNFHIALVDGVLELAMNDGSGARAASSRLVELLREEPPARDTCMLMVRAEALDDVGKGLIVGTFPLEDEVKQVTARLYLEEVPAFPPLSTWVAPQQMRTRKRPKFLMSIGSEDLLVALGTMFPEARTMPVVRFGGITVAMLDEEKNELALVITPRPQDRGKPLEVLVSDMLGLKGQLRKAGKGLHRVDDLFLALDGERIVMAGDKRMLRDLLSSDGEPWFAEEDLALGGEYPILMAVNEPMWDFPVPVSLAFRGEADHAVVTLRTDNLGDTLLKLAEMDD